MRIVIDMQGAQTESRFRGIGRYTLSFAQGVVRNRGEHEVFLALCGLFPDTIEPIRAAFDGLLPQENIRVWHAPGPVLEERQGNESRRERAELLRESFLASLQPDVIHISSLFEGYVDDAVTSIGRFDRDTPISVSLYDLIPLLNSDQYFKSNPRYRQYYHRKIGYLKQARCLLAISECARQEGLSELNVSESTVVNVSTAIDPHFKSKLIDLETVSQVNQRFHLTRPFVLYAGGADERKNLPRLIQAYAALPNVLRQSHQLLLAGKMPEGDIAQFRQLANAAGLEPDELRFTGYVSDEEIVHLYNLCALFVFPSWHEGFGLPALEAMACGAPVIGANTSSLPEVIGLDEALFEPMDVKSISAKMELALKDASFQNRLRQHGLQRARLFSWDETAKRAIRTWEAVHAEQKQAKVEIFPNRKPKLAFVSPLPPERTGIADYSAELLPALAEYYEIEVVVAQAHVDDPWVNRHCKVRDVAWLRAHAGELDRVIYQVGNSPFHQHMLPLLREIPGTVVLHDFFLSGLMAWLELHAGQDRAWTNALYDAHGYGAVQERYSDIESAKRRYPVNLQVLQYAQGLIFHSIYSCQLLRLWFGDMPTLHSVVIPLLRSPAKVKDKFAARNRLGLGESDFLVCSFGFLDPTKLNHRLLDCWFGSALAEDKRCHLVFVGENHGGEYGSDLLKLIEAKGGTDCINITGFADADLFREYLAAADIAVQLRTNSRGETSAAVLDCMNHGLPLIANANGSIAELEPEAVWLLPDEFEDGSLIEALETLWRNPERRRILGERARQIILDNHSPSDCARSYAEAIERFHRCGETAMPTLIRAIAEHADAIADPELLHLSKSIAANFPLAKPAKSLYLDVTATCSNDLKTGIERVVRALLLALLKAPPPGYRIEPVYLDRVNGGWCHRYARRYTLGLMDCPSAVLDDEICEPERGDILLGLDLSGDKLVHAQKAGLFADYRSNGVLVYFMVHDLLPIRMPEVFPPGADEMYLHWLSAVSTFDGAICVSKAVSDDLASWQREVGIETSKNRPFRIDWSHHGADVANSAPSLGLPDNAEATIAQLQMRPSFLMVGTIEPRKGYLQTIEAFTQLWNDGYDVNLVVVGREGWKGLPEEIRRDIPETIRRLRNHPELDKRLFWLDGISDEYLEKVYADSTCLIAASYGEGFGLPLIEAAQHKLPIIARDIPVFREVAGHRAYYFDAAKADGLVQAIKSWLVLFKNGTQPESSSMLRLTWKQSANRLAHLLFSEDRI